MKQTTLSNALPIFKFSHEGKKAIYWITVCVILTARLVLFGFDSIFINNVLFFPMFGEEVDPQMPSFYSRFTVITILALHSLYIISLPVAAYAKSAKMIRFALYAFAGSMIMPLLFSLLHFVAFVGTGWPNLPLIMIHLLAPLVLLYSNNGIIRKHRHAFQKTFRAVVIITLLSTAVYLPLFVPFVPQIVPQDRGLFPLSTMNTNVFAAAPLSALYNLLFGGLGHVPMLAMVIVWRYLDTNRFNSILRIFTTIAATFLIVLTLWVGILLSSDYLAFFLLTLPGFIFVFFMARVAVRSVTAVHPFRSLLRLGPKPTNPFGDVPTDATSVRDYPEIFSSHPDEEDKEA